MKLYCTTYIDDGNSTYGEEAQKCAAWYGTQMQQAADAKRLKREMYRNLVLQRVNVPTGKAGLLAFLNERGVQP